MPALRISLDTDWLWRVLLSHIGTTVLQKSSNAGVALESWSKSQAAKLTNNDKLSAFLTKPKAIGQTALWVVVLLTVYVVVYYL